MRKLERVKIWIEQNFIFASLIKNVPPPIPLLPQKMLEKKFSRVFSRAPLAPINYLLIATN